MLWFSIKIKFGFKFGASVAFDSAAEIIVLTLGADPPTFWEIKTRQIGYRCAAITAHPSE